jgi:hypothetical protein
VPMTSNSTVSESSGRVPIWSSITKRSKLR